MPRSPVERVRDVLDAAPERFAGHVKEAEQRTRDSFGNVRVFFNPIYVSDICSNDCVYCGYRRSNTHARRRTLNPSEAAQEAKALAERNVRHILMLAGEYSMRDYVPMLLRNMAAIREAVPVSWLGMEIAALAEEDYRRFVDAGAEAVVLFQETYDRARYAFLHRFGGSKTDFDYRYAAFSRAIRAGFREVGLGVLYGVGEWRSDSLAMAEHAVALVKQDPGVRLRFSFPRLMPSEGQEAAARSETITEDVLFKILVAFRIAFPNAATVLTGRESTDFLLRCLSIVNVIGKQGSTTVGGYSVHPEPNQMEQFTLDADCTLDEFRRNAVSCGYSAC